MPIVVKIVSAAQTKRKAWMIALARWVFLFKRIALAGLACCPEAGIGNM